MGAYKSVYCKSRIFRMHFIFVYFVHGGFCTKIKCILKIQSKSETPQRSAAVQKFMHTKGRGSLGYENLVRTKYSGFTVSLCVCVRDCALSTHRCMSTFVCKCTLACVRERRKIELTV